TFDQHATGLLAKSGVRRGTYSCQHRFPSHAAFGRRNTSGGIDAEKQNKKGTIIGNRRAHDRCRCRLGSGISGGRVDRRVRTRNVVGFLANVAGFRESATREGKARQERKTGRGGSRPARERAKGVGGE